MSLQAKVIDQKGKAVGEQKLSDQVFGEKTHDAVVFDTVLMQLASRRQGTAKTKTRSEVRGGGKKPFKQKGTGSARQGSSRSGLLVGGGRIFGPRPRSYEYRLPRKVREKALRAVLSDSHRNGKLFIVKEFKFQTPKVGDIVSLLAGLNITKALFVDSNNQNLHRSVRNIKNAKYLESDGVNVFDILKYQNIFMSSQAISKLEERLGA